MLNEKNFYVCQCGGEAIALSAWYEDDELEEVLLSYWRIGHSFNAGWRERLRHIWHIIRYGHPYADEILLSPSDAANFAHRLLEIVEDEGFHDQSV